MKLTESTIALGLSLGFFSSLSAQKQPPRLGHKKGDIVGSWKVADGGREYEAYEGIPYAQPPVDGLRFEPPIRYLDWPVERITLLAKQPGHACPQFDELKKKYRGSEDCLFLNVYRPKGNWQEQYMRPVIFYIHGDDFQSGNGADHGAKYLLARDVVLVTINYRLGPLGFLSTEDDVVPGNMGLKDQALALHWVNQNIEIFGGDKTKVLIAGHGAGGASVHYHYLGKPSRGLFRKGLSMSGTALAPWAQTEGALQNAERLGKMLNCPIAENLAMIKCLQEKPVSDIVSAAHEFRTFPMSPYAAFAPVAEHRDHQFTFISQHPSEVIAAGNAEKVPWVTSYSDGDGLAVAGEIIADKSLLEKMEQDWSSIAPILLDYRYTVDESKQPEIANAIKEKYLGKSSFTSENVTGILNMIGDRMFENSAVLAAVLHADHSSARTRMYEFSYRGAHSFSEISTKSNKNFGAAFKDELAYVFDLPVDMSTTEDDRAMRKFMLDFWVTYATDQFSQPDVPEIDWIPLKKKKEDVDYLLIQGPKSMQLKMSRKIGNRVFWRSLRFNENHYPVY